MVAAVETQPARPGAASPRARAEDGTQRGSQRGRCAGIATTSPASTQSPEGARHAPVARRPAVRRRALRRSRRRVRARRVLLRGQPRSGARGLCGAGRLRQGGAGRRRGRARGVATAHDGLVDQVRRHVSRPSGSTRRADAHDADAVRQRRSRARRIRRAARAGARCARRRRTSSASRGRCSRARTSMVSATPKPSVPTASSSHGCRPAIPSARQSSSDCAASVYRQAEARQAAGDVTGAVRRVPARRAGRSRLENPRHRRSSTRRRCCSMRRSWERAATVLEQFRRAHPDHALRRRCDSQARGRLPEVRPAARRGGRVRTRCRASRARSREVRRTSLWQAAELYAQTGDDRAARRASTRRTSAVSRRRSSRHRSTAELADSRWRPTMPPVATLARRDRHRRCGGRRRAHGSQPFPRGARDARAREAARRAWHARSGWPCRSTSALAAKKQAIEQALPAYTPARRNTGSPRSRRRRPTPWPTCIAHLGKSLLESERPRGLDAGRARAIRRAARGAGVPVRGKSDRDPRANARRAADGIYDDWVRKSYAALAELKPARSRTEIDADLVAPPPPADAVAAAELRRPASATRQGQGRRSGAAGHLGPARCRAGVARRRSC